MAREPRGASDVVAVLEGAERIWVGVCGVVFAVLVGLRGLYSSYRVGGVLLLLLAMVGSALALALLVPALLRRRWSRFAIGVLVTYGVLLVVVVGADLLTS